MSDTFSPPAPGNPPTPPDSTPVSAAVARFKSCRWRRPPEDGPECCGHRDVLPIAGTSFNVPQYTYGIFGLIIVVMMLLRPQGLIPGQRRKVELELGVEGGSLYDASSQ